MYIIEIYSIIVYCIMILVFTIWLIMYGLSKVFNCTLSFDLASFKVMSAVSYSLRVVATVNQYYAFVVIV